MIGTLSGSGLSLTFTLSKLGPVAVLSTSGSIRGTGAGSFVPVFGVPCVSATTYRFDATVAGV